MSVSLPTALKITAVVLVPLIVVILMLTGTLHL